jgi:PKD repeat protein
LDAGKPKAVLVGIVSVIPTEGGKCVSQWLNHQGDAMASLDSTKRIGFAPTDGASRGLGLAVLFLAFLALLIASRGIAAQELSIDADSILVHERTLAWDAVDHADLAGYELHYGEQSGQYAASIGTTETQQTVSGLDAGKTYFFAVKAVHRSDRTLDSVFSNEVSATIADAPPQAGFTMSVTEGVAPLTVAFADASTGTIDTWAWSFADGATSTSASPSHTFTSPGSYSVTLEVSGPGGTASATAVVTVASPALPPVADFAASASSGFAPLSVTFTDQSSGEIESWQWDFGDGGTSTAAQAVWTYQLPGTYSVSLTVTGPGGSDTLTKHQLISVSGLPPVAGFDASTRKGSAALSVAFKNHSAGEISSVRWDFGDGKSSTELAPTHIYTDPGVYDVALTVTGPYGSDSASKTDFIEVTPDEPSLIEVGEVVVDQEWQWVELARPFVAPIVVANPPSANDAEPALVRISGVESTGFWIRIQEWDYLDGIHGFETVSYLVMEQGSHLLPSGQRVEAGKFIQGGAEQSRIGFAESFATVPVVLASVTSLNDAKAVTPRVNNVTRDAFQLALVEQETIKAGHGPETIHYIAWPPSAGTFEGLKFAVGRTRNEVTDRAFNLSFGSGWDQVPVFLGHVQTINDADPAALRSRNLTAAGVEIWAEEERSRDGELKHGKESVGWIIFNELN